MHHRGLAGILSPLRVLRFPSGPSVARSPSQAAPWRCSSAAHGHHALARPPARGCCTLVTSGGLDVGATSPWAARFPCPATEGTGACYLCEGMLAAAAAGQRS